MYRSFRVSTFYKKKIQFGGEGEDAVNVITVGEILGVVRNGPAWLSWFASPRSFVFIACLRSSHTVLLCGPFFLSADTMSLENLLNFFVS